MEILHVSYTSCQSCDIDCEACVLTMEYSVYVVWLAIESLIIYFVYPETKGPSLEELSQLFEDENPLSKGRLDLERQGSNEEKPVTTLEEVAKA